MDQAMQDAAALEQGSAWRRCASLAAAPGASDIRAALADPGHVARSTLTLDDLTLDLSRSAITAPVLDALLDLAAERSVPARLVAQFGGQPINATEGRAVLHTALRAPRGTSRRAGAEDAGAAVDATLAALEAFVEGVHQGRIVGSTGQPLDTIVNIGIGGSDLGPAMVVEALASHHIPGRQTQFVANVDAHAIAPLLDRLDPRRTLFLIASKTFTTQETMANAATARAWLAGALGEDAVGRHFAALSTNLKAVDAFGIPADRTFGFRDWVGGRYSVWSAVGASVALAIGWRNWEAFLAGGHAIDRHVATAEPRENLAIRLGLFHLWHATFRRHRARAVLAYDQRLHRFAAHLQQLEMESNGKGVALDGRALGFGTSPVVFGEPGTNAQHSFMQLVHQGTDIVPVDFLLAARPDHPFARQHRMLAANLLAQAEALAVGRTEAEARAAMAAQGVAAAEIDRLAAHRTFPGDRPSAVLLFERLDPATLGRLLALYEHKVAVEAAVWGINAFDQFGVELGKELAGSILPALDGSTVGNAATAASIERMRSLGLPR